MTLPSGGLSLQRRLTLVVGKGGVGKTTLACALAAHCARQGRRVLVVSTDPAHSLADCLGVPLRSEPTPVAECFWALQIDPGHTLRGFLGSAWPLLHTALDRGAYLDRDDITGLLNLPLPGIDEVTGLLELMRRLPDAGWERVVLDTAPTGHTERLLKLPHALSNFSALLDDLQERHRFMVARLARAYRPDEVDRFLWELRDQAEALERTLRDPAQCGVVVSSVAEPVIEAETLRYLGWLRQEGLPIQALVLNLWEPTSNDPRERLNALEAATEFVPIRRAPRFRRPPTGLVRLRRFGALLAHGWEPGNRRRERAPTFHDHEPATTGRLALPFATTPLQFFVGKGGVGKSTLSSVEALALSTGAGPALLVSLDPAHSLGDIWATKIGDTTIRIADNLWAIEVDGPGRWRALRDRWDATLGATIGQEGAVPGWRETLDDLRRVLELVPPGIDEVIGLFLLAELWESQTYRALVVDCAPTGHLLRLLALPELALEWVRMLMRLTLKYRAVIGIGALAEELIAVSKQLKATISLLRDAGRCAFLPITIAEPLSIDEMGRLVTALEHAGMPIAAVILNRPRDRSAKGSRRVKEQAELADRVRLTQPYPVIEVPAQAAPLVGHEALAALIEEHDVP